MAGRLDGKVAIITGAGRGIGEAAARATPISAAIVQERQRATAGE